MFDCPADLPPGDHGNCNALVGNRLTSGGRNAFAVGFIRALVEARFRLVHVMGSDQKSQKKICHIYAPGCRSNSGQGRRFEAFSDESTIHPHQVGGVELSEISSRRGLGMILQDRITPENRRNQCLRQNV